MDEKRSHKHSIEEVEASPRRAKQAKNESEFDEGEEQRCEDDNSKEVGGDENLSDLNLSTRDKRIRHFNYGHLRRMPASYTKRIADIIEKACPEARDRIRNVNTALDQDKALCFELAVLEEKTCAIAVREYRKYLNERDVQVEELPHGETQVYQPGVKCSEVSMREIKDDDSCDDRTTLTCKDCIIAYRNNEERTGYCRGCSKMVCSLCSLMCIVCNCRWCEKCTKNQGPWDEGCCHAMELDGDWFMNRNCQWK